MQTARELVETGGSAALSMRALAAESGISAVTAYAIFGSKAGILRAIVEEERAKFAATMKDRGIGGDVDSIFQTLHLACDLYRSRGNFFRALFGQYVTESGVEIRAILDPDRHKLWHSLIVGIAEEGMLVAGIDTHLFTDQLENVFLSAHFRWSLGRSDVDRLENEMGYGFALLLRAIVQPDQEDTVDQYVARYGTNLRALAQEPG